MEDDGPDAGERRSSQQRYRNPEVARDQRTGRSAASIRVNNQTQWVEHQLRRAVERGDFDDLPGYGKPIEGLGGDHDPDWWVKKLIEREQVTVLPPALALRVEDRDLDARLDRLSSEREVRRELLDFNARVHHTLYTNLGGPPVLTQQRDVESEVQHWRQRREQRRAAASTSSSRVSADEARTKRGGRARRWWPRR